MKERIKRIRQTEGMTQAEFAEKINLSRNYIAMMEIGQREPSDRTIADVCRVFGVDETWLRTGVGEMHVPKSRREELSTIFSDALDGVNERFRFIREELGLSQEKFAARANRTRSEIKNIEYGKTSPKPEVIMAVCKAHGIDEVWLRTGNGSPNIKKSRREELSAIFGSALDGVSDKDKFLRALASVPDSAFPALVEFARALANELGE